MRIFQPGETIRLGKSFSGRGTGLISIPGPAYLFRDKFLVGANAPLTSPRNAEPGPGQFTITDTGNKLFTSLVRLRGGGQTSSPTWGSSRLIGSATSRAQGRAFAVLITPQDFTSDWWAGLSLTTTPGNPSTAGLGLWADQGLMRIVNPSANTLFDNNLATMQPKQILLIVILQTTGAYILASTIAPDAGLGNDNAFSGLPQYPTARLLWLDSQDTTATLYPVISYLQDTVTYPNGHAAEDARVIDITSSTSWSSFNNLAQVWDSFTGTDATNLTAHTANKGAAWTVDQSDQNTAAPAGAWTIVSNKAKFKSSATYGELCKAWQDVGISDGLFQFKVTTPASGNPYWGMVIQAERLSKLYFAYQYLH
jgi:hypothetical protein